MTFRSPHTNMNIVGRCNKNTLFPKLLLAVKVICVYEAIGATNSIPRNSSIASYSQTFG
jgi:hypothetical protein